MNRNIYPLVLLSMLVIAPTSQAVLLDLTVTASWTTSDYDVSSTGPSVGALGIPEEDDDLVFGVAPSNGSTSFTLRIETDSAVSYATGYNGITHDWWGYSDVELLGTHTFGSATWTTDDILTDLVGVDSMTMALWTDTDVSLADPSRLSFRMMGDWEGATADLFIGSRTITTISDSFLMWEYYGGEEIRNSGSVNAYVAERPEVSVPSPVSFWLMGSGLIALIGAKYRKGNIK